MVIADMTPAQILLLVQAMETADAGDGKLHFNTQDELDAYMRRQRMR